MSQKITLTMAGIRRIFFHSDIKPSRFHQRHRINTKWCHYLNHTGESRFVFKRSLMRTVVGSFIFFLPHRYGLHFCDYVHTILQPNAPFSAHIRVDPVCIETCVPDQITYFSLRSLRIQFDWTVKRHLEIQKLVIPNRITWVVYNWVWFLIAMLNQCSVQSSCELAILIPKCGLSKHLNSTAPNTPHVHERKQTC